MEILPPSPFPNPASSTFPLFPPSISHSSIMSFFFSCVLPPRCPEFSSFWVSLPFHSNRFSPPPLNVSFRPLSRPPTTRFLNCGSDHFYSSCLLILLSPYPPFNLILILSSLDQWPSHSSPLFLSLGRFPLSRLLKVHQMVHFSLTQCILIPMAVACRVRAVKTTATVY